MTVAVVDRLVHHATIFEMNVESYRRRAALERKRGRGRLANPRDNHRQRLIARAANSKHSSPLAR
jgi:IstB-like ATP binding protein